MLLALTRAVPQSIDRCELTHLQREPIDYARAVEEHEAYEACLRRLGCRVERLPDLPDHPDSVFVEDTAVVFDRVAVIARPGAASRRGEVESTARALAKHRTLAYILSPGTLDGGDVLVLDGVVFVGVSGRTNADGARQLATILAPHGILVVPVPVTGCLHLKSAVTAIPIGDGSIPPKGGSYRNEGAGSSRDERRGGSFESTPVVSAFRRNSGLLINPAWVNTSHFSSYDLIEVDPSEPDAANVLAIGDQVVCAEAHTQTRRRLEAHGIPTEAVPVGELAKAEGGLTCGSIIFATVT
jgi:dimethylargininase